LLTADNHHQPTWTRLNPTSETVRPSESDGIAPHPLECQQAIARWTQHGKESRLYRHACTPACGL